MYQAGWAKQEIYVKAQGYAMMGYGMWHHRAWGQQTPLFARAIWLADEQGHQLAFCCLDLGYITYAMRSTIVEQLKAQLGQHFNEEALVLTCTHTHSGPGGCTHDALYNVVTPGFVPDNLQQVVAASVSVLLAARANLVDVELSVAHAAFAPDVPVAWNRSLTAYNRNPEISPQAPTHSHLALNREMPVLAIRHQGQVTAFISLFGVHATAVGNRQTKYCADNKGYAAVAAEQSLAQQGVKNPIAIFAQATAGDVSPHYHGPDDLKKRKQWQGDSEYLYAEANGQLQAKQALHIIQQASLRITGSLEAILTYVDLSQQHAEPRFANGEQYAFTSEPCHGVAFFEGTRIDGPGMPQALATVTKQLARLLKAKRLRQLARLPLPEQQYYQRLYAAQGVKDILLEAGRKTILGQALHQLKLPSFVDPLVAELKRQAISGAIQNSALVPSVLPIQLIRLGNIVLVCCPGEFTTIAGQRIIQTVTNALANQAIEQVLICTYCNDYMGYVTTYEEYQQQAYEGGHTMYGQWTLAAFQTCFAKLAAQFALPAHQRQYDQHTRPAPPPAHELALRSGLMPPKQ